MSETTRAAVSAAAVIAVNVGAMFGLTLDAGALSEVISAAALLAATGYAIWKNHNFTRAAQEGQRVTDSIKAELTGNRDEGGEPDGD